MTSRLSSWEYVFLALGCRRVGTPAAEGIETTEVSFGHWRSLVSSGDFQQLAMLAPIVLASWEYPDLRELLREAM